MLGTFVEESVKKALHEALTWVFPAHQLSLAQNDLKLPGANPAKFTLGKVQIALQKINDDSRYRRIGFHLDETFFEEFDRTPPARSDDSSGVLTELMSNCLQVISCLLQSVMGSYGLPYRCNTKPQLRGKKRRDSKSLRRQKPTWPSRC
jgi:hypothetical protein